MKAPERFCQFKENEMKTHDITSDNESRSRAAANDRPEKTKMNKGGRIRAENTAQCKQTRTIDGSPFMVSQTKRLRAFSEQAVQKQDLPEEEELMQGKFAAQKQIEEDEDVLQGKMTSQMKPEEEEELMQGKFVGQRSTSSQGVERMPLQPKPNLGDKNRTGMPNEVKTQMEEAFNTDFSDVRVHSNSSQAKEVGALAYTQGANVHFAPGQFKPETSAGRQLLGHELAHVLQQRQGRVQPTGEVAGLPVNDSPGLENEADRLGEKVEK